MNKKDKQRAGRPKLEDNSESISLAKAERLKRVRHLANLSREEFCSDGKTNISTLISWELGRFGGLSAKGAERVIARVAKEGVFVTQEWLLYEIGSGPEVRSDYKKLQHEVQHSLGKQNQLSDDKRIVEELMLFKKLNDDAIDFIIKDDAMLPHYNAGDYVAGTRRFGDAIKNLLSYDCIVQINDGRLMMRKLQAGPRQNSFNLISTNHHTKSKDAIIYDVELASAAPVLWHRRKEP